MRFNASIFIFVKIYKPKKIILVTGENNRKTNVQGQIAVYESSKVTFPFPSLIQFLWQTALSVCRFKVA